MRTHDDARPLNADGIRVPPPVCDSPTAVVFFGLADFSLQEVVEFYATRQEAEQTLRDVLRDEPDWREILGLVRVEFGSDDAQVEVIS